MDTIPEVWVYEWSQTDGGVVVDVEVPQPFNKSSLKVVIASNHLNISIDQIILCAGAFCHGVDANESIWQLESGVVSCFLEKMKPQPWKSLFQHAIPEPEWERDEQAKDKHFKLASSSALLGQAMAYELSPDVPEDVSSAILYYEMAAFKGEMAALIRCGDLFHRGKASTGLQVTADPVRALCYFLEGARRGNPEAQFRVAGLLHYGEGKIHVNGPMAQKWYQHAADQGHAYAAYNLGVLYAQPLVSSQNENSTPMYEQAVACWEKASQLGCKEAWYNLGVMYQKGTGVKKNEPYALKCFEHAGVQISTPQSSNTPPTPSSPPPSRPLWFWWASAGVTCLGIFSLYWFNRRRPPPPAPLPL